MSRILLLSLVTILACAAARADVVYLTDGTTMEGQIEDLGNSIRVRTASGSAIKLPKGLIARIEKRPAPQDAYPERLVQLKPDDAEAHFRLALWCEENQLMEQYASLLEKTLQLDPGHAEAKKRLYAYNKYKRPIPVNEEAGKRLLTEFGPKFKIHRTAHYQICYDCDDMFLNRRSSLFEKVYERFYRFFEDKGFSLDVITERLDAVLLNSHEEYVSYIQEGQKRRPPPPGGYIPPAMALVTAGMYIRGTNRVLFYNAVNDAKYREIRRKLSTLSTGRLSTKDQKNVAELRRQLSVAEMVDQNVSTTIHEAVHQLTFNLGLLNPQVDNPDWLVEGLAMYFEPATEGEWIGPGHVDRSRLETYFRAKERPDVATLLWDDSLFHSSEPRTAVISYATAWALTYFLLERHPAQFAEYLRALRAKRPGGQTPPAERMADFFKKCLGNDLSLITTEWPDFMSKLKK